MKIDMVFTYCDGTDPKFIEEKKLFLKKKDKVNNTPIRFLNIGEITYSVRSVLKFIPWINMIYIITNKQIPPVELNPKIKIIDHTEIIPKKYLPTFNSDVIESFIHNIPELSEIFLYNNDDMMHTSYVDISDIIHGDKIVFRNNYKRINHSNIINEYLKRIYLTSQLFYKIDPSMKLINNHHTKILRKSTLKFIEEKYPKLLHELRVNRVRGDIYIQYLFFCINIDNILNDNIILNKYNDVLVYYLGNKEYREDMFVKIYNKKPKFLCLNDMSYNFKEPFDILMTYIL
jgi:hypothetical protein